jgi:hypothetical protein
MAVAPLFFDVTDPAFGADPTGQTDSTAAFQAALVNLSRRVDIQEAEGVHYSKRPRRDLEARLLSSERVSSRTSSLTRSPPSQKLQDFLHAHGRRWLEVSCRPDEVVVRREQHFDGCSLGAGEMELINVPACPSSKPHPAGIETIEQREPAAHPANHLDAVPPQRDMAGRRRRLETHGARRWPAYRRNEELRKE